MPLQATSGAASYDAFGGGVAAVPNYIEDVFSTCLYTGNGSTQTITNGIDLAGEGGLVWFKDRSNAYNNGVFDTARGNTKFLYTNTTAAQVTSANTITSFNADGFSLGVDSGWGGANGNVGDNYVSWTFRKQPKFFDVVTWSGNSFAGARQISHSLGSKPAVILVKNITNATDWLYCYSVGSSAKFLKLNLTNAESFSNATGGYADQPSSTSTYFEVYPNFGASQVNETGSNYVAYLFAHNAGGFGLTGTDNVISCGSYTGTGAIGNAITLGYEPQWVMIKEASGTSALYQDWYIYDNMRGMPVGTSTNDQRLMANLSSAEASYPEIGPTATGFVCEATGARLNESGGTYIYIAIRRGPMKVPTDGTSVFEPATRTGTGTATTITSAGFPVDLVLGNSRNAVSYGAVGAFGDRLRGKQNLLYSEFTSAEDTANVSITGFDVQNGISVGDTNAYSFNYSGGSYVNWFFRRAPSFFDEVCYTGNDAFDRAIPHNLAAVPELVITKVRSTTANWAVYSAATGLGYPMALNTTAAAGANPYVWGTTAPTSTNFYIGDDTRTNGGGFTYVSYLFATCAGVSKVGSYTGTGTTQQINCGFTAGSRFVLIRRTDSTGDWYVWDSARGIVAGTDPRLALNSTAAEVNANWVYATTGGFEIVTSDAAVNASGGSYIFLSVA